MHGAYPGRVRKSAGPLCSRLARPIPGEPTMRNCAPRFPGAAASHPCCPCSASTTATSLDRGRAIAACSWNSDAGRLSARKAMTDRACKQPTEIEGLTPTQRVRLAVGSEVTTQAVTSAPRPVASFATALDRSGWRITQIMRSHSPRKSGVAMLKITDKSSCHTPSLNTDLRKKTPASWSRKAARRRIGAKPKDADADHGPLRRARMPRRRNLTKS